MESPWHSSRKGGTRSDGPPIFVIDGKKEADPNIDPEPCEVPGCKTCSEVFRNVPFIRNAKDALLRSSLETCETCNSCFELGNYERLAFGLAIYHMALKYGLDIGTSKPPEVRCALCSFLLILRSSRGVHSVPDWPPAGITVEDLLIMDLPTPSEMWNIILYSSEPCHDQFNHATLPGRLVPRDQIDMSLVRGWLRKCETEHGAACNEPYLGQDLLASGQLTLIDVLNDCLTHSIPHMRYLTLSYVWGQAIQLRLLTSNASRLFTPGGLSRESISMLKTIRDALEAVRKMGERYIWIDALCIIQDSPEDLQRQLPRMGSIYGESLATLIAVEGTNAHEDLPGVRPFTRKPTIYHQWPDLGIDIAHRRTFRSTIERSRYETRGWTFQERLLAKRCIFFSASEVSFQCREQLWFESLWEDADSHSSTNLPDLVNVMTHWSLLPATDVDIRALFNNYYIDLVQGYTKKTLGNPQDILNAFAGIEEHITKTAETTFLCGLCSPLTESLLWYQPTVRASSHTR
ncbi:heterokaryon incompatibility protein-domain-containing protein [Lasiosphaeria hispida]|uniref:Heterokaryon incompatibility protein-domain-containing protein n=1 Tax=Lasiosphaeria hispida TaxID=260671 RepID=A0AAJ0MKM2_9PEZI|nr:heterokaryon incompatibility protein-domain-containing protein [Lasiosphaeria hispida]